MKCIFCKSDSSNSVSVEHVIPESLGNDHAILPKGVVCDSCNNYFASKVEKPVLESEEFTRLRFSQLLKSKKGRIPETEVFFGKHKVKARRHGLLKFAFNEDDFNKIESYMDISGGKSMLIPYTGQSPSDLYLPRFLAKMALEAFVSRIIDSDGWNDYIVEHKQFDAIRNYARRPKRGEIWKYSKRRIYEVDNNQKVIDGIDYQVINEWDILIIGNSEEAEYYFVIAIFGMEYAINIGGSNIDGYKEWLKKHDHASPLYTSKNT